jgi:glycerate dehydrogenase
LINKIMRIAFLDATTVSLNDDIDFSSFKQFDDFKAYPTTEPGQVVSRLTEVDCVMTNKVPITREVIESVNLKHIAVVATGYNNIDLNAATNAGISVSNVPGYASNCVPQHVFALLLNLVTSVDKYNTDVHNGEWQKASSFTLLKYHTTELSGKTIGIIGFGHIGQAVARIGEAFGMRVLMNRKSGMSSQGYPSTPLSDIYRESDVISLNCPLTADNKYMIDRHAIAQMKPTVLLINTARGPLVNQGDLAEALKEGTIAGAGIDVLDTEPPTSGSPLLNDVPNCIITPHSAWSTIEARSRLIEEVALNIRALADGVKRNIVDV